MLRKFPYITVGQILAELNKELQNEGLIADDAQAITRATFYRLEKRIEGFPAGRRTSGARPWRIFSEEEKNRIKEIIRHEYWS